MTYITLPRTRPAERAIEFGLRAAAAVGIVTTVGIIAVLTVEALLFFAEVSPVDFFTGTRWSASIKPFAFGVIPLIVSTLMIAAIALAIAVPIGILAAVWMSEFASMRSRNIVKPILEILAGIPTIVYGFFAITVITPLLKATILPELGTFSALSAGIVVGILILPLIASLTEDALRAVPRGLREGSYAMGATRWETVRRVLLPAALSGIAAAVILAMSRAIGETMAVVLAAGTNPQLTIDPTESVQTMTAFIVQISLGDTPADSLQFKALFAVGATLFAMTFALNMISTWIVSKYRNEYD
jgi:phosphate transport system permease protein|uniref:phosphate ABC transporter permease subunit PstC n=1 Tax=Candidatus Limnocylindrus sp. TaxID=2802978 RepID=UPI004049A02D